MGDLPTLLFDIASDLLQITNDALREEGTDPVDRTFVDIGSISAPIEWGDDCQSQLAVTAGPLNPDPKFSDPRTTKCALVWRCRFDIVLMRCYPTYSGNEAAPLPTPDQLDAQAREHYADLWQLSRVLSYNWYHGLLVPSFTFRCENTQWSQVQTIEPHGGVRGVQSTFYVTVHDLYEPEGVTAGWE